MNKLQINATNWTVRKLQEYINLLIDEVEALKSVKKENKKPLEDKKE